MKFQILAVLGALALSGSALAQNTPSPSSSPGGQVLHGACAADVQTLCAGKTDPQAFMCIRQNIQNVSPACRDAMNKLPRRGV